MRRVRLTLSPPGGPHPPDRAVPRHGRPPPPARRHAGYERTKNNVNNLSRRQRHMAVPVHGAERTWPVPRVRPRTRAPPGPSGVITPTPGAVGRIPPRAPDLKIIQSVAPGPNGRSRVNLDHRGRYEERVWGNCVQATWPDTPSATRPLGSRTRVSTPVVRLRDDTYDPGRRCLACRPAPPDGTATAEVRAHMSFTCPPCPRRAASAPCLPGPGPEFHPPPPVRTISCTLHGCPRYNR